MPSRTLPADTRAPGARAAVDGDLTEADVVEVDVAARHRAEEVLAAMLDLVKDGELAFVPGLDGMSAVFQRDGVRCVVLVGTAGTRQVLSPRELQIARLVADGATNRAIAATLEISLWTVSTHVRRIFTKTGVGCRAEMVAKLFGVTIPDADQI